VKLLFVPFSVAAGLVAGLAGKKLFERVWRLIDDREPPEPEHRDISPPKMVAALALEGAIFRATRGLADHAARRAFERATGRWPGEAAPQPE
jgi:hypothetical protein